MTRVVPEFCLPLSARLAKTGLSLFRGALTDRGPSGNTKSAPSADAPATGTPGASGAPAAGTTTLAPLSCVDPFSPQGALADISIAGWGVKGVLIADRRILAFQEMNL